MKFKKEIWDISELKGANFNWAKETKKKWIKEALDKLDLDPTGKVLVNPFLSGKVVYDLIKDNDDIHLTNRKGRNYLSKKGFNYFGIYGQTFISLSRLHNLLLQNNFFNKNLNDREKDILLQKVGLLKTYDQIGKCYGITRQRTEQIFLKTLKKLNLKKIKI